MRVCVCVCAVCGEACGQGGGLCADADKGPTGSCVRECSVGGGTGGMAHLARHVAWQPCPAANTARGVWWGSEPAHVCQGANLLTSYRVSCSSRGSRSCITSCGCDVVLCDVTLCDANWPACPVLPCPALAAAGGLEAAGRTRIPARGRGRGGGEKAGERGAREGRRQRQEGRQYTSLRTINTLPLTRPHPQPCPPPFHTHTPHTPPAPPVLQHGQPAVEGRAAGVAVRPLGLRGPGGGAAAAVTRPHSAAGGGAGGGVSRVQVRRGAAVMVNLEVKL